MDYQKAYENKIGSASLNINKAVAGSKINCRLTYKVGSLGIDDSGGLKVLFRIVSDCADPQFEDPKSDNYVAFSSTNKNVQIAVTGKSSGMLGKVHERPWSKGFVLNFSNDSLSEKDEVYLDFKNWRAQTFCEKTFEFKILVDPFATARFLELPHSTEMEIIPDKPEKIVVLGPTRVRKDETFTFLIKLEDKWENPCTALNGVFAIEKNEIVDLPSETKFNNGKADVEAKPLMESTCYINGSYGTLSGVSNPIVISDNPRYLHFWGDLHGQSEETVGTNDINDYFNFAKEYAFLDVAGHQANDFQVTNEFWNKINETTKKFTRGGEFVAFPGYEWSGNTPAGGDRNVLYLKEGMPIYRSSHALVDEFSDLNNDVLTVNELFKRFPKKGVITIAHVGGRYSNLNMHDEKIERAVEVHSDWGTFEWFIFDALKKGYKVGVVAGSDCHDGRLGASYPGLGHFQTYGGLTCFLADELTREAIFEALYYRHAYATTGAKIYLDVTCLENGRKIGIMGDELKVSKSPVIKISTYGTSQIDRIEFYGEDRIIKTFYPPLETTEKKAIKVVWSGSKVKGRRRSFNWKGNFKLSDNKIAALEYINVYNKGFVTYEDNQLTLNGVTTGGTQGVILYFEKSRGTLEGVVNDRKIRINLNSITQLPKVFEMGGLDAKLQIYKTSLSNIPGKMELEFPLKNLTKGIHPIFVKIVQKDGHMAWSSPIFLASWKNL